MDPSTWARSLDTVPDALLLVSPTGVVVAHNEAAGRLVETGTHLKDATGHGAAEVARALALCARSSSPIPTSLRLASSDDDAPWAVSGARVAGWSGEHPWLVLLRCAPTTRVAGAFTALNDRVDQLSREVWRRRHAEEALRATEERFRLAFDFALTAMALESLADGEVGRILRVNTAMCELLGRHPDELVGSLVADYTHPDDLAQALVTLQDLNLQQIETWQGERRFVHSGGAMIDAVVRKSRAQYYSDGPAYIVTQIEDVTAGRAAEQRLVHLALHDDLTGLANRALLLDRLGVALARRDRTGHGISLLYLDLDDFKNVNDSLGHSAGDALLRAVGDRLTTIARASDTVARLGGDEFAVLCEGIHDPIDISAFADRILTAVSAPLTLGDRQVVPSASIGVVTLDAVGHVQPESVMRDADLAMYRAKRGGKNRHASFDLDMRTSLLNRLDIETGLRLALPSGEFHLAYQPVVDLHDDHRTIGVEALLRWTHPTRGELPPGDFLPVAEETGLIEQIGAWVLLQATSDADNWYLATDPQPGASVFRPTMAVNVSVRQIGGVALRQAVEAVIEHALIEPSRIHLEITESQFMSASASTIRELTALRELGLSLSLDDFGTGYSSLSYLKHFPFDTVKLDRSFVAGVATDPGDRAIITAILGLAGALELRTVAEGVETAEQADILTDLGCQHGQGWHFGRPMPFAALVAHTAAIDPRPHGAHPT